MQSATLALRSAEAKHLLAATDAQSAATEAAEALELLSKLDGDHVRAEEARDKFTARGLQLLEGARDELQQAQALRPDPAGKEARPDAGKRGQPGPGEEAGKDCVTGPSTGQRRLPGKGSQPPPRREEEHREEPKAKGIPDEQQFAKKLADLDRSIGRGRSELADL
eukprot:10993438-Heterocapsa_arctica.AAC.2